MDLSVVIVSYNVRHFLEQTLRSVEGAMQGMQVEVFVVDNNSVDGSQAMVAERFPWVHLIANEDNRGFARANNQAIRISKGRHILLLNPDTVVQEDTFQKVVAFMDKTPEAGGLGVKMVDGKGRFLPESKRSLPTPWVAFHKIFGLSALFPNSRRFGRYHLTYLSADETHPVEVLSGAFMLLRREMLDKVGLLDEDYFMYGEDVDLSYRILLGGYKNYYFADTQIIHYKGESTKKGSLNYVVVFYTAMLIFARKHFAHSLAERMFMGFIRTAIYLRAGMAIARRIVQQLAHPLLEWLGLFGVTLLAKVLWEAFARRPDYYPPEFNLWVPPLYASLFVFWLWVTGAYRRPYRIRLLFAATVLYGFASIALVTFLTKFLNFSRGIAMLSSVGAFLFAFISRSILSYFQHGTFALDRGPQRRTLIVGQPEAASRVLQLLGDTFYYDCQVLGVVTVEPLNSTTVASAPYLGTLRQLDEIVRFHGANELIFCNDNLSTRAIIEQMVLLAPRHLHYKILPPHADYLVGPNTILSSEELAIPNLHLSEFRWKKQLMDWSLALGLLVLFPFTFWRYRKPGNALGALVQVLKGERYLVGYVAGGRPDLPRLKPAWLSLAHIQHSGSGARVAPRSDVAANDELAHRLDTRYARSYTPTLDLEIVWKGFRHLGASSHSVLGGS